jgi:hypothetical protein
MNDSETKGCSSIDMLAELQKLEMELNSKFETQTKKLNEKKEPSSKTPYNALEYNTDIQVCILKTTICNIIMSIHDADIIASNVLFDVLKNTIILHGKTLCNNLEFVSYIEDRMVSMELSYNVIAVYKMLRNIRDKKSRDNIHLRVINNNDSNMPPITAEARLAIERRLPQTRFSRQLKKKPSEFVVGEIVGCKDRNNNWYLSEVLHIHDDPTFSGYWYYINFKGWGLVNKNESTYNEWISSESFRVRKFNPRRHLLKRHNTQNNQIKLDIDILAESNGVEK